MDTVQLVNREGNTGMTLVTVTSHAGGVWLSAWLPCWLAGYICHPIFPLMKDEVGTLPCPGIEEEVSYYTPEYISRKFMMIDRDMCA